jgi:hypothetical protein
VLVGFARLRACFAIQDLRAQSLDLLGVRLALRDSGCFDIGEQSLYAE